MSRNSVLVLAAITCLPIRASAAAEITLVNGTHFAVLAVQAKPHGALSWQGDLLEENTLGIGKTRRVGLPGGFSCDADFLATLDDGHKVLISAVNVCRNATVAVTDNR